MTNYFYVPPEQLIKDRAEFAQKGIARGRSIVAAIYDAGVLLVAENPSASLNKISEIYDRIAFAGVGKYNEFDRLREAGIRWADSTGFTYSREDVDARALANYYAQHLGDMFTEGQKPLEVEILVAQLGNKVRPDQVVPRRVRRDHLRRAAICRAGWRGRHHQGALRTIRRLAGVARHDVAQRGERLSRSRPGDDPAEDLEVCILEDRGTRRTFQRLSDSRVSELLG